MFTSVGMKYSFYKEFAKSVKNQSKVLQSYRILKFAANFLLFQFFCSKNAENDYFDQRLECAAPKRWLKYTTGKVKNVK